MVVASLGSILTGAIFAAVIIVGGVAVIARRAARSVKGPPGELAAAPARSLGHTIPDTLQVRGKGRLSLTDDHLVFTSAFPFRVLAIARVDIAVVRAAEIRRRLVPFAPETTVSVLDVDFAANGHPATVRIQVAGAPRWVTRITST